MEWSAYIRAMTTLTIHPSTTEWNIREFQKNYETEGEEGRGGRGERRDGLAPFALPTSFLCLHSRASPRPPRAQTYLKLPQTLHNPDDMVIDILFIITLFFHKLLAPHWAPAVPSTQPAFYSLRAPANSLPPRSLREALRPCF